MRSFKVTCWRCAHEHLVSEVKHKHIMDEVEYAACGGTTIPPSMNCAGCSTIIELPPSLEEMARLNPVSADEPKTDQDLELLCRAVALQGAHLNVLQRVLVRVVATLAERDAEGASRALADGVQQLKRESTRLASAGYRETLTDLLTRFDVLRSEMTEAVDLSAPTGEPADRPSFDH